MNPVVRYTAAVAAMLIVGCGINSPSIDTRPTSEVVAPALNTPDTELTPRTVTPTETVSTAKPTEQNERPTQAGTDQWVVTCGLPLHDNPLLALLPTGGYNGPWGGPPSDRHLEVKTLHSPHPDGGLSTQMWVLSDGVGWWRLKAIRVHPDDISKASTDMAENVKLGIRQIIDSPFLEQAAVIRVGQPEAEEVVTGQILALMPPASQLRCAPQGPSRGARTQ